MNEPTIVLDVKLRGERASAYLPEEGVEIDIALRNVSSHPVDSASLSLNPFTPVLQLFDDEGALLSVLTPEHRHHRRDEPSTADFD